MNIVLNCSIYIGMTYLVWAFSSWELNPGNWDSFFRFIAVAIAISLCLACHNVPFSTKPKGKVKRQPPPPPQPPKAPTVRSKGNM